MDVSVSQKGLSTPMGNIVSFDDIHALLHSVDSGKPFKVQITTIPVGNDQKRLQLQIQNCTDIKSDATNTGNDKIKRTSEYYDSCALVKQLQSLDLRDESVVDQILTNPRPAALSELSAAHKNESMIPLVTAKDGRTFSILAGRSAYSDWAGKYPIGFSRPRDRVRKLGDPALAHDKITAYQNDALKKILAAVCAAEDSSEFLKAAYVLHPDIYENYMALIAEPIDLGTMRHMLHHNRYKTMAEFRRHVDLLEQNARTYCGERDKSIAAAAAKVKSDIHRRLDELPAEPPFDEESVTQIRRLVAADDDGSSSAVNNDTKDDTGAISDEVQGAATAKANRFEGETGSLDGYNLVLPLGRLCVARNADADGFIITPYIVITLLEYAGCALLLVKDFHTPVGLPDDKKTLLDFDGKYNFAGGVIAAHIDDWKIRPSSDIQTLNGKKVPLLHWPDVVKLIRVESLDEACIFDFVENQLQAAAAIKKGWSKPEESSEEDEIYNFSDEHEDPDDEDYNDPAATSHMRSGRRKRNVAQCAVDEPQTDDASDEWEPPSKRTRSMIRVFRKTL